MGGHIFERRRRMDPVTMTVGGRDTPSPDGRRVARQLESSFASDMLRAARPQKRQGLFDGGAGSGAFDSFMDNALGDALTAGGGFGLTSAIERVIVESGNGRGGNR
jgi:Rod binding domain-containing protein